jgi:hypothetical protein
MKRERFNITVRVNGVEVRSIKRALRSEMIGNFNPMFCTYQGRKHLVQSTYGDISDPFRRTDQYLLRLYIETM